jgi:hypothetical protein
MAHNSGRELKTIHITLMKSQKDQILEALLAGEILTPLDALNRFGCFRIGARIEELKSAGYDIENLEKPGSFARYKIKEYKTPQFKPHIVLPSPFPPKPKVQNTQTLF